MIKTLPITQARDDLPKLVNNAKRKLDEYIITVNGTPAAVVMSVNEYESWKETNEIMADRGLVKAIKSGEKDLVAGRVYDWKVVKKELNVPAKTHRSSRKRV